jgi:hypothetical protein
VQLGVLVGDVTTLEWQIDERLIVRYVAIAGLGQAWSGGDDALPFNDARTADASALVGEFLRDALPEYAPISQKVMEAVCLGPQLLAGCARRSV